VVGEGIGDEGVGEGVGGDIGDASQLKVTFRIRLLGLESAM
jgi:hypothetical protein